VTRYDYYYYTFSAEVCLLYIEKAATNDFIVNRNNKNLL